MAHLVETMMSVKETPWHKLGKVLQEAPTAAEAIVQAGLDWEVEKRMTYFMEKGGITPTPDRFAVVRKTDGSYLGHSGKTWQPLQNKDAFSFFDPYIEAAEASYETAGSLNNGKQIWVLAKINRDPIEVVKGDTIDKYILLANHHTGGIAVTAGLTPIRVVCNNTLTAALSMGQRQLFRASHSYSMQRRLEEIQADIARADKGFQQAEEYYKRFASKQVNQKQIDHFLSMTFGWSINPDRLNEREKMFRDKQTETILRLFETGRGADIAGVNGTVWGLYNAVTEFIQYERGGVKTLEDQRLKSAWFGEGMALNKTAFNAGLALVTV